MVELQAKTPGDGFVAVSYGDVTLRELSLERITSVAPFNGADKTVSAALNRSVGAGLPEAGRIVTGKSGQILWSAMGQYFVLNAKVPKVNAAVTDQSDAWACVGLEGHAAGDVLARLCPLNLGAMDEGDVGRSLIGHMPAIIVRRSDGYDLMVFRAFASTLLHELETAMRSRAAQMQLR